MGGAPNRPDQTFPGKWLVGDFLVDRATADYDVMLTMSADEIEAMKNRVRGDDVCFGGVL